MNYTAFLQNRVNHETVLNPHVTVVFEDIWAFGCLLVDFCSAWLQMEDTETLVVTGKAVGIMWRSFWKDLAHLLTQTLSLAMRWCIIDFVWFLNNSLSEWLYIDIVLNILGWSLLTEMFSFISPYNSFWKHAKFWSLALEDLDANS